MRDRSIQLSAISYQRSAQKAESRQPTACAKSLSSERGTALLETALVLPMVLLVLVGIFEFGRAYQTWQVLTNAAREGARVAVLPNAPANAAAERVAEYLSSGQIDDPSTAAVRVATERVSTGGGGTASATRVTVDYPYEFIVLQPVARMVRRTSTAGNAFTMTSSAVMRNE